MRVWKQFIFPSLTHFMAWFCSCWIPDKMIQILPKESTAVQAVITTAHFSGRTMLATKAGATVREKQETEVRVQAEGEAILSGKTEAAAHTESGLEARVHKTEVMGIPDKNEVMLLIPTEQKILMLKGDTHPMCTFPSKTALKASLGVTTVHMIRSIGTAPRRKAPNTRNINTRSTKASQSALVQRMTDEKENEDMYLCVCVCACAWMFVFVQLHYVFTESCQVVRATSHW